MDLKRDHDGHTSNAMAGDNAEAGARRRKREIHGENGSSATRGGSGFCNPRAEGGVFSTPTAERDMDMDRQIEDQEGQQLDLYATLDQRLDSCR